MELKENDGSTALYCACGDGHTEAAVVLLERGANMDATNNVSMCD